MNDFNEDIKSGLKQTGMTLKECVERQIPKKVIENKYGRFFCSNCMKYIAYNEVDFECVEPPYYCRTCGQKIDWSDKNCSTCEYHTHEDICDGWVCTNSESEHCADWTEYEDVCDKWKERE